ncbi:hypothetical protein HID58_042263 [Brassica napus]|uniref:Uncharacterized protein n=1 Tax=Brassica napus TaxID=3708 RepID=A0ABQ8BD85_BRANA|nr:hypothetical protein HID58_042263 [Brassica napus]
MAQSKCLLHPAFQEILTDACWCGEPCYISTSGTPTTPGRLYYCCGKGYNKVRFGSYFACSVT